MDVPNDGQIGWHGTAAGQFKRAGDKMPSRGAHCTIEPKTLNPKP
jgi:hypothetical protein